MTRDCTDSPGAVDAEGCLGVVGRAPTVSRCAHPSHANRAEELKKPPLSDGVGDAEAAGGSGPRARSRWRRAEDPRGRGGGPARLGRGKDMRHGRKSRPCASRATSGTSPTDLDLGLILSGAITPANRPEEEAAPCLAERRVGGAQPPRPRRQERAREEQPDDELERGHGILDLGGGHGACRRSGLRRACPIGGSRREPLPSGLDAGRGAVPHQGEERVDGAAHRRGLLHGCSVLPSRHVHEDGARDDGRGAARPCLRDGPVLGPCRTSILFGSDFPYAPAAAFTVKLDADGG